MKSILTALQALLVATVLTGIGYPLATFAVAQLVFPKEANGSLLQSDGTVRGSWLIGQAFNSDRYFQGRPSAAGDGYDAANSAATNLAPSNAKWVKTVKDRAREWQRKTGRREPVPIELITASGSGLDPDLSVAAARYQIPAVARARGLPEAVLEQLVSSNLAPRSLRVFGEPRVNVLRLNLALDQVASSTTTGR